MNGETLRAVQAERVTRFARWFVPVVILLFVAALVRVGQLKTRPTAALTDSLEPPISRRVELGRRGDIVDRRGRVLATSVLGYRLFLDPEIVENLLDTAREITSRIGGHPQEILQLVRDHPGSRYVVLSHLLEPWQVDAIRQARIQGVGLDARLVREYPNREVGAAVIGMVGFEHTGLGGAEHRFDPVLRQQNGELRFLRDARNRVLWIEPAGYAPKRDGDTVRLSLDVVLQAYAEQRLDEAVAEFNARGGRLMIADVRTGDILAMADLLRTEDREGFIEVIPSDDRDAHPARGRNRCATDPYEPGSTFKPFVWSYATMLGVVTPDEVLDLPERGPYRTSRGRRIRDVKPRGAVPWLTVLVKSLNSGMALVGERLTPAQLQTALDRFGFGTSTASGIPGESRGIVTSPRNWTHYSQTSVPMGQEIAVTPLQMLQGFSAFCRDGTMIDLRLVAPPEEEHEHDVVLTVARRAVPEETAMLTREAMRRVMLEGTGQRAQSERYRMFGKSGTAQLPIPRAMEATFGRRGFFEDRYTSSFIAGAPFDDPRIAVLCVLDDPDRSIEHYGGITAGPVVRDTIDFTLSYLGVEPDQLDEDEAPEGALAVTSP